MSTADKSEPAPKTKRRLILASVITFFLGMWCVVASLISYRSDQYVSYFEREDRQYVVANFISLGLIEASNISRRSATKRQGTALSSVMQGVSAGKPTLGSRATESDFAKLQLNKSTPEPDDVSERQGKQTIVSPLSILVGVLGAGLCGSTLIIFIRLYKSQRDVEEEVNCRSSFVLWASGMASSLLVYLAYASSLSVVANVQADPQPYFLIFLCFMAAMHSQKTLNWAEKQLEIHLKRETIQPKTESPSPTP